MPRLFAAGRIARRSSLARPVPDPLVIRQHIPMQSLLAWCHANPWGRHARPSRDGRRIEQLTLGSLRCSIPADWRSLQRFTALTSEI